MTAKRPMSRAYMREMGFSDEKLAAALTEITGSRWSAIKGDTAEDRLARRWAFDRLFDLAMAPPVRSDGPSLGSYAVDDPETHASMHNDVYQADPPPKEPTK